MGKHSSTIGFIGAGHIGANLARLAVEHGFDVVLSNRHGPETLTDLIAGLGPRARAGTAAEAALAGDVVVLAIPLTHYREVPAVALAGKIVIDTVNYYPQVSGPIPELDDESTTVSELLAEHLAQSRLVKAFNTVNARHLLEHAKPSGEPGRRVVPIAGDDAEAKKSVIHLMDEWGFDALDAGPLAESWRFQRGTPSYGRPIFDAGTLRTVLDTARRYRDQ